MASEIAKFDFTKMGKVLTSKVEEVLSFYSVKILNDELNADLIKADTEEAEKKAKQKKGSR